MRCTEHHAGGDQRSTAYKITILAQINQVWNLGNSCLLAAHYASLAGGTKSQLAEPPEQPQASHGVSRLIATMYIAV